MDEAKTLFTSSNFMNSRCDDLVALQVWAYNWRNNYRKVYIRIKKYILVVYEFFELDVTTSGSYDFRQRTNQLVGARSTPETSTTGPPLTVLLVQSPSDWLEMRYKKASSFVRNYRSSAAKRSVRLKRVGSHWLANRRGLSRAIQENLAEPPCRQA